MLFFFSSHSAHLPLLPFSPALVSQTQYSQISQDRSLPDAIHFSLSSKIGLENGKIPLLTQIGVSFDEQPEWESLSFTEFGTFLPAILLVLQSDLALI